MKKNIITITGMPGSGKSSTANKVADALGYARFSSGDFMRSVAFDMGLTIEELNRHMEKDPTIDRVVDAKITSVGETETNLVIDSRLAWHWIPQAFKVFLKLDTRTAAERVFRQIQNEGRSVESAQNIEEMHASIEARLKSEQTRYANLYDINYLDESNYDLVIDTKENGLDTVTRTIISAYQHRS